MTMAFSNFNLEISKKAFFVVNISIVLFYLFLHETSHIEKFEGTDFDNGNSFFFKFQQKILKYKILFENLKVFSF